MTEYPYSQSKPRDPEGEPKPCADCDLSGFDSVKCEVEGVAAEAEYLKEHQEKLKTRRTEFDRVRTLYDKSRLEQAAALTQITTQLKRLREQLECQLDEEKRRCLTDGWRDVLEQLKKCGEELACCVTEDQCRFDWDLEHPTPPQIRALIEDFERRVKHAENCFDNILVKEPDELKKRVTDLKKLLDEIAAVIADPKTTDYSEAFAKLLWAEHLRRKIWLGFDDPNDFADCLCLALNCSLQGRRALAKLTGLLKTLECKEQGEVDRCNWLRLHVVEEILAACRRNCPPEPYDDSGQSAA